MGCNANIGDNRIGAGPKVFDHGNQANFELAHGELIGQAAGQVQTQLRLGSELLKAADERLGIQVIDGAHANGSIHGFITSADITANRRLV